MDEPELLPLPDSPEMTTAAAMLLHILKGRRADARAVAAAADDPAELAIALAESWATTMLGDIHAHDGDLDGAGVLAIAVRFARELITAAVTKGTS